MNKLCLIGGPATVVAGKNSNLLSKAAAKQWNQLLAGHAYMEIPLNGGSETRQEVREYWQEKCFILNIPFRAIGGWLVIVGNKP